MRVVGGAPGAAGAGHGVIGNRAGAVGAGAVGAAAGAGAVGARRQRVVRQRLQQLGHGRGAGELLAGDERVAGGEGVAQPQLQRVDAQGLGQAVHLRLVGEADLHHPEAPHRPARRVVGAHPPALHDGVGHPVGAGGEEAGVGEHGRGGGRVGAAVEGDGGLHLHELAVGGGVVAVAERGRVAVHVAEERLLPVVEHLHRAAGVQRQQAQVDLQGDVLAGAESAAHARQRDVHVVGREAEGRSDLALVGVEPLRGDEQLDAPVAAGQRQARLGAHEGLILHAHLVVALHLHVAGGVGVAVADRDVADDVAVGVDGRGVGGCGRVGDGLQGLVVDDDGLGGPAGGLGMVGGHQRHRFAAVTHHVAGQHPLVGVLEAVGAAAGNVLVGQHGPHAGDGQGGGDVDGADAGVRVRRAQRPAPHHAVCPQIGGELERSSGFGDAVGPGHALADPARRAGSGRRLHPAAGRSHRGGTGEARLVIQLHNITQLLNHPVSTHPFLHFVKGLGVRPVPLRTIRPNAGSQDTSPRQRGRRAEFGSFASAAAGGDSYNNALAESVIALSRSELFRGRDQSPPQSVDDIGPATSGRAHSHNPGRLLSHLGDIRPPGGPPTPQSRTGLEINRPHSTKLGVVHHHPRSRGGWSAAGARRPFHLHWEPALRWARALRRTTRSSRNQTLAEAVGAHIP